MGESRDHERNAQSASPDGPAALRLLAHEVRSPLGVLQGYLRMMEDGRVDDQTRPRVIGQMRRAAARLAVISQQASDLARWMTEAPPVRRDVSVEEVLDGIAARTSDAVRLRTSVAVPAGCAVRTPDLAALTGAGAALVELIARRTSAIVVLGAQGAATPACLDIVVAAADQTGTVADAEAADMRAPVDLQEGGAGLSLFVVLAVVQAHGGTLWQSPGRRAIGMTLPCGGAS